MEKSAEIFEGSRATNYDNFVRVWILRYAEMISLVPSVLNQFITSSGATKDEHILVAGCGSGSEIIEMVKYFPDALFTGVDPSPDMVALAASKLEQHTNIKLMASTVDLLDADIKYDATTLLLVMHFLSEPEKFKLLSSITERLTSNAPLIIADIFGSGSTFDCNLCLLKTILLASIPEEEVEARIDRIKSGIHYIDEGKLNMLLGSSGFTEAMRFFQSAIYGAWVCVKK